MGIRYSITLHVGAINLQNHRPVTVQECPRLREVLLNSYNILLPES